MGLACGCEFCWICEKEYVNGSHQCNSVRKEKGAVSQGKQGDFQYLAHYYKRYKAHDDGKKFDEDNRRKQKENVESLSKGVHCMEIDPEYLVEACEVLIDTRRKLKWTYAYAFFLEESPQKEFFEFLQAEIEEEVDGSEGLALLIEAKVPPPNAKDVEREDHRQKVMAAIHKVQAKVENLRQAAREGSLVPLAVSADDDRTEGATV